MKAQRVSSLATLLCILWGVVFCLALCLQEASAACGGGVQCGPRVKCNIRACDFDAGECRLYYKWTNGYGRWKVPQQGDPRDHMLVEDDSCARLWIWAEEDTYCNTRYGGCGGTLADPVGC